MNVRLAFDGFDAGPARLLELAQVEPSHFKFDMSLIRSIHTAPAEHRQRVAALVRMVRKKGILSLAEGIETKREAQTVAWKSALTWRRASISAAPFPCTTSRIDRNVVRRSVSAIHAYAASCHINSFAVAKMGLSPSAALQFARTGRAEYTFSRPALSRFRAMIL